MPDLHFARRPLEGSLEGSSTAALFNPGLAKNHFRFLHRKDSAVEPDGTLVKIGTLGLQI